MAETVNQPTEDESSELAYQADDDQISTFITNLWRDQVAYFRGSWWRHEAGLWVEREESEVRNFIRKALRPHREMLKGGIRQGRISSVSTMLQDDLLIPNRKISEREVETAKYVNLQNGLFNLETLRLEEHNPDLYFTTQLDFAYEPDADCRQFKKFLRTSLAYPDGSPDHDMVMLAQEALAYSMTARTDMKASFWLVGKPDTGKSTLIGFIRSLMGNLHATVDLNQLSNNRFLLAGIVGKRVVTFTEADSTAYLPDALYKAMVGGSDEVYTDVKNKPGISFVPTAKFWWGMNSAPKVNDRSGATLNRLRPILFDHIIPSDQRNPNLPNLLHAERSGVFNYLIVGYQRLVGTGEFTKPERGEEWIEQYKRENDVESLYADDRLEFQPNYAVGGQELYDDYRAYCERNGYRPKNAANAAKEWRRLGLSDTRGGGRTTWRGARLVS